MKQLLNISLLLVFLIGCEKPYTPRESISLSIENFEQEGTSIRAIEELNDSTVAFAGSIGDIVAITKSGRKESLVKVKYDTIIPHFRSISVNKAGIFALAIGNPALLYKIEGSKTKLVYMEHHELVFYDSMAFFNSTNGIAMGDPTSDCLSIITTSDGGNSWTKLDCEDLPTVFEGEAAFAASNTNISIVNNKVWIVTGGKKARVLLSENMGKSWKVYDTPIIQGENTTGIYTVDFYDELQGIICGGDYTDKFGKSLNKAITKDGGMTWEPVGNKELPHYVSCVQYIPGTDGTEIMAVSTNGIFYSNNGGNNFQKVSEEGFYTLRFIDRNTAWLAGNEKIALLTIK